MERLLGVGIVRFDAALRINERQSRIGVLIPERPKAKLQRLARKQGLPKRSPISDTSVCHCTWFSFVELLA
jgi:hypothetical protein